MMLLFMVGKEGPPVGLTGKFSEELKHVLTSAQQETIRLSRNYNYVADELIVLALIKDQSVIRMLKKLNIDPSGVKSGLEFVVEREKTKFRGRIGLTPRAKKIIELAVDESQLREGKEITPIDLLIGVAREDEVSTSGVLESQIGHILPAKIRSFRSEMDLAKKSKPENPKSNPSA